MGTYDDSRFVTVRKAHECDSCGKEIDPGKEALSYKLGQRWTVYAHTECVMRSPRRYQCAAVSNRNY